MEGTTILCPALHGLPLADALALAMLPIHDANARALSCIPAGAKALPPPVSA